MSAFLQDLQYGLRKLRTSPGFTLVAVLTLAIGIGANTVMFGIVDAILFRPPAGVVDASHLMRVELELQLPNGPPTMTGVLSYPDFVNVRDRAKGFAHAAAFARTSIEVGRGDQARSEPVMLASGDYFATLGTRAAVGRTITVDDDRESAAIPVAMLGWEYFQRAYSGDPRVIGQSIVLNGHSFTIIGVAPKSFTGIDAGAPSLWVPLGTATDLGYDDRMVRSRFASWLSVIGRLAPNAIREQAQASVQAALLAARDEGADLPPTGLGPGGGMPSGSEVRVQIGGPGGGRGGAAAPPPPRRVSLTKVAGAGNAARPGRGAGRRSMPVSLWFLAITGTVLLIACANVANLLLVRAANRSHEIAVRLSLGATRERLARQLLTESLLLAALGGAAAVGVAIAGAALLPAMLPLPPMPSVVDDRALLFTAAVAAVTTLAFGLAPAWRATRQQLYSVLGVASRARAGRSIGRDALVVVQLGASLALLVAAGLFVRSLRNVKAVDTGFAADRLLLASADVRGARFTREQAIDYWNRALARVKTLPGVRSAALGAAMPFEMNITFGVDIPSAPSPDGRPRPTSADFVDPDFFATAGIPIVQGRAFNADDRESGAPVAIVNQTFVRRYLHGVNPLSACINDGPGARGGSCSQIVGVVADAHYGDVTRDPDPFMYRPIAQRGPEMPPLTMMYVRTTEEPAPVAGTLRRELQSLDARVAFATVRPMTAMIEPQLAPWRIGTFIFMLFGVIGALLAAVGLYGVVSFVVAQRTREFGVRLALGAQTDDVFRLVLSHGARLVGVGLIAGAIVAALSTRLFVSLMFGVSALDPFVYVVMALLLAVVALVASYVPALRATRVDPIEALRTE
ncbi:MAG TPA: ABC transporter permease [Gemmatimonadaceae bacterium]|jgi:predicted permease